MSELQWMRSRRCNDTSCVEVAQDGDEVVLRDSKDPTGGMMRFSSTEWADLRQDFMYGYPGFSPAETP